MQAAGPAPVQAPAGDQHPARTGGTYPFTPVELAGFRRFPTTDECTAYIDWATQEKLLNPGRRGHTTMNRWRGVRTKVPLSLAVKQNLVQQAADARILNGNNPPYHGPQRLRFGPAPPQIGAAPPVPIDALVVDWDYPNVPNPPYITPQASNQIVHSWRYVKTLWTPENGDARASIRLFFGEDGNGNLIDRVVVKEDRHPYGRAGFDPAQQGPRPQNAVGLAKTRKAYDAYGLLVDSDQQRGDAVPPEVPGPNAPVQRAPLRDAPHILKPRCTRYRTKHRAVLDDNNLPELDPATGFPLHEWWVEVTSYTDDCEYGSLDSFLLRYRAGADEMGADRVPEMFIWLVVKAIADSLHHMETGNRYEGDQYPQRPVDPGWRPILHRNVTPETVLLKKPAIAGAYPVPMLTYFDLAERVPDGQLGVRPTDLGTYGYKSPENLWWARTNIPEDRWPREIGPPSDLWGLGNLIWDMHYALWSGYFPEIHQEQSQRLHDPAEDTYRPMDSTIQVAANDFVTRRRQQHPQRPELPLPHLVSKKLLKLERRTGIYARAPRGTAAMAAAKARGYLRTAETVLGDNPELHGSRIPAGKLRLEVDQFQMGRQHRINRRPP